MYTCIHMYASDTNEVIDVLIHVRVHMYVNDYMITSIYECVVIYNM